MTMSELGQQHASDIRTLSGRFTLNCGRKRRPTALPLSAKNERSNHT